MRSEFKVNDEVFIIKFVDHPIPDLIGKKGIIKNVNFQAKKYPIEVIVGKDSYIFMKRELIPVNKQTKILFGEKND